jgi:hypothetical protein
MCGFPFSDSWFLLIAILMPYTLGQEADHDIRQPLNSFIMVFGITMALCAPIHYYKNAMVVVSLSVFSVSWKTFHLWLQC